MKTINKDETSGNPFPPEISLKRPHPNSWSSTEGYYHDRTRTNAAAQRLGRAIDVHRGQQALDIGFGSNLVVAHALRALGMETYGLDPLGQEGARPCAAPIPPRMRGKREGIPVYQGCVEEILHDDSELRDMRFDLLAFWGSWTTGGNNYAIGGGLRRERVLRERPDIAKALLHREDARGAEEALSAAVAASEQGIMRDLSTLLNPGGGILVVSSRYAFHGAGFTASQLPMEKRGYLHLGHLFDGIGAEKLLLFGLSKTAVAAKLSGQPRLSGVGRALCDDATLFSLLEEGELAYSQEAVDAISTMDVPLGRIDALYARF